MGEHEAVTPEDGPHSELKRNLGMLVKLLDSKYKSRYKKT